MNGRFYNKMPFSIPMRKVWLPGSPAMQLEAGGIIEGPTDILSQFSFLSPLSIDFSFVDSTTQNSNFEFKDAKVEETAHAIIKKQVVAPAPKPVISPIIIDESVEKTIPEMIKEIKQAEQKNIVEPDVVETKPVVEDVPPPTIEDDFDPNTVNWLFIKNQQLEAKCKQLNVDISSLADIKTKARKWELIRMIKQACNIK